MPTQPSKLSRKTRVVLFIAYDGCQSLDITGPWEVFSKARQHHPQGHGYRLSLASPQGGTVTTNSGLTMANSLALSAVTGRIDTLLVAGGDVAALDGHLQSGPLLPWLRAQRGRVRRIGSVCTGAFALAAAGLLDGKRAATHWQSCAQLAARHPLITVEPDALYVNDPPVHTSAGITAGIDLALNLVEADLGAPTALAIARELVLFLRRPGGQSQFSVGLQAQTQATPAWATLIHWMIDHPDADLSLPALALRMSLSERHFSRLFQRETGQTPARFVTALRLERAKALLQDSTWPLERVAQRAGWGSVDSLQRALRSASGVTAVEFRRRFAVAN